MNTQQTQLYQRIQAFSLDAPYAELSFSQRLAQDNSWTQQYTQRVIEEYKKFIFLAMVAGHPVTPPDQVDQVWHLHLTYTHSYWDEFCGKTLHKALHHHPTRGGFSEQETFRKCYDETLISYEKFFAQPPPDDIWVPAVLRFSHRTKFRRINSQAYWLIPKPSFQISLIRSISVPRFSSLRLVTSAALSLLVALILGSIVPSITTATTDPLHFIDAQSVVAQVTEKPAASSNTLEPWVSRLLSFLAFSALSFMLAIGLSFRKSYVYPGSKARNRIINKHELGVYVCVYIGFLCIIILLLPKVITFLQKMLHNWNSGYSLIIFLFSFVLLLYSIPTALAEWVCECFAKLKKQKSLQLLYCRICNSPLQKLDSIPQILNKAEQVAAQIGSTEFEAWYCQQCCSEIERDSIHLRTHVKTSNKFNRCSSCKEVTMISISRVLEEATEQKEGRRLIGYQCRCCGRSKERIAVISRISSGDGCACM